ncbi:protein transport protein SEC23 [Carica papaya]|uniref:protein transport protein SEC23 n=1 Tax=Carica papaya TaxID=3649 RepID=UPI000B8CE1E5|nr:protein transport protein SEC23 [Carica papaya]
MSLVGVSTTSVLPRDTVEGSEEEIMQARPVYVAAIDLSSSEEFLELTKSALLAALEALVPGALFGLATFSHKLGLYDVQGPIPVVKNVFIPADAEETLQLELEDVMPLLQFLAPVETCKDRITAALETLRPTTSWERSTGAVQGLDGVLMGGRGFGVAMESLFKYLGSEYGNTFALARVFAFLSGPPDYGAGQLDTRRYGEQYASKGEDADCALLPEQTSFYKDLANVAVQAGVCVDIFAVTNEYTDLASLKFLSIESGGSLFLYSNTDDSTLPQDMYRMLSRPYAFNCILRLRTSSEFSPGHSYGHFFLDPQYENVQHIICCDSYATYAYDFDFANNTGFSRPFKPIQSIGKVAYKLDLPSTTKSHPIFHVSSLEAFHGQHGVSPTLPIVHQGVPHRQPHTQLASRTHNGQHEVLIHWEGLSSPNASSELANHMKLHYSHFGQVRIQAGK